MKCFIPAVLLLVAGVVPDRLPDARPSRRHDIETHRFWYSLGLTPIEEVELKVELTRGPKALPKRSYKHRQRRSSPLAKEAS